MKKKAEEIKAKRLKRRENMIQYRQKRKAAATPEEKEASRLKRVEQLRQYRQEQREKEESILKKALDLVSQNKEMSFEENAILGEAEEIKAKRLKKNEYYKRFLQKRKAEATPEAVEKIRCKRLDYKQKKIKKDNSILKKAMELLSQNQKLSSAEKDIVRKAEKIKAQRLKKLENNRKYFSQKRKAAATPEEIKASRLKKTMYNRQYRQEKEKEKSILKSAVDLLSQIKEVSAEDKEVLRKAEEIKAKRLRIREDKIQYLQERKAAATPEEKEASRLKKVEQLRQYRQEKSEKEKSILKTAVDLLSQHKEVSAEDKEVLRKAEEIEAKRLKKNNDMIQYRQKRKAAATPEEIKALRFKKIEQTRQYRQEQREKEESILKKALDLVSQNKEMSFEEDAILKEAQEIKAKRLKERENMIQYRQKRKAAATPEEKEASRLKKVEQLRQYRQEQREKEESILKKALLSENKEISFEEDAIFKEVEEIKAKRLQISQRRKASATPEEIKASRLKKTMYNRQYRQEKSEKEKSILKTAVDLLSQNKEVSAEDKEVLRKAEEIKAKRLRIREDRIQYLQERKAAATPEEKEASRLKKVEKLRQYRQEQREKEKSILKNAVDLLSQNKEVSAEDKEVLRKAEEIKAKRLKKNEDLIQYRQKRKTAATPEEMEASRLKKQTRDRQYRQEKREKEEFLLKKAMDLLSQNKEMSFEDNAILRKAKEVKAKRLKRKDELNKQFPNRKPESTPEKIKALKLKHLQKYRKYNKTKRDKDKKLLKKAMELVSQNQKLSSAEKDIVRKAEKIKAQRLKKRENMIQYRQRRRAAATPEEIEAIRRKKIESVRQCQQKQREKEDSILKKALDLISQHKEMSFEEISILRKAEEVKAKRMKKNEYFKQYYQNRLAAATPEEVEEMRLKRSMQRRQNDKSNREGKESKPRQATPLHRKNQGMSSKEKEILRLSDKINVNRSEASKDVNLLRMNIASGRLESYQVSDEIKIEKEVIQETRINAIPANSSYLLDIQERGYNDSSCSRRGHSEKSFMTGETIKDHSYFHSFHGDAAYHSTKFDERKLALEKSFRCMRELIDATAKRDGHVVFGQKIAQKLRSSKKNSDELDVAKQLIDDILQKLSIGVYSIEIDTKIV